MNAALWIAQVLLALIFVFAGAMKLVTPIDEQLAQMPIGLPPPFLIFTGVVELLGGLGVILPWLFGVYPILTPLAAAGLVVVMIGAAIYTAAGMGVAMAMIPLVVGLLAAFVAWGRWRALRGRG